MEKNLKIIHPAYIAAWASVVAAGHIIPTLPLLTTGANFSLANILSPLSGVFFGPVIGALCSAIGGFIGSFISPVPPMLGPFYFIISGTTAFTAGCIAKGKWPPVRISMKGNFIFNGGIIVYLIGTILWFTQETGRSFIWIPIVVYGLGFAAMITGFFVSAKFLASDNKKILMFPAIWLSAFGGLIGGATVGNFFYLIVFNPPAADLVRLLVMAPLERALFATVAMLIGVPLLEGLRKIGINTGTQEENFNANDAKDTKDV